MGLRVADSTVTVNAAFKSQDNQIKYKTILCAKCLSNHHESDRAQVLQLSVILTCAIGMVWYGIN